MSEDASKEQDLKLVRAAAESLGEHFDTVMIFATRHESGESFGTISAKWGTGNWFARFGQVKEWVTQQEELSREQAREKE